VYQGRRKHVKVDRNFVKEKLDSGLIYILFVSAQGNHADLLTTGLNTNNFEMIVSKLVMIYIHFHQPTWEEVLLLVVVICIRAISPLLRPTRLE